MAVLRWLEAVLKGRKLVVRALRFNFLSPLFLRALKKAPGSQGNSYSLSPLSLSPRNARKITVNFFAYINFNSPYMSANLFSRKERLIPSDWKLKYSASHSCCIMGSLCGPGSLWLVQFHSPSPQTLMATYCVQGRDDCFQELLSSTREDKCSDNPGTPRSTIFKVLKGSAGYYN